MRVNYLSYCEGQFLPGKRALEFVSIAISKLTKSPKKEFENISSYPELLNKLSECFSQSNIIILAVDVKCYNKTKSVLFKTMNLKCKKDSEIIDEIKSREKLSDLTENQIVAQAAVPVDSEIFITVDGLFSGFGIEKNRQRFVVFPLDSERVDVRFIEDICVFLSRNKENYVVFDDEDEDTDGEIYGQNIEKDVDDILDNINKEPEEETEVAQETDEAEEIEEEPEETEEFNISFEMPKPAEDKTDEKEDDGEIEILDEFDISLEKIYATSEQKEETSVETRFENYNPVDTTDIIAETLTNVRIADLKIAFAVQSDNKVIDNYLNSKIVFKNNQNFAVVKSESAFNAENEEQFKSKLSAIAREAMNDEEADVGMAVSNLLEDEDGRRYVFSAMCDQKKTNIYKVYSIPGESHEDVVKSAIINMFESLNAKVIKYNEAHQESESKKHESKKSKKLRKSKKTGTEDEKKSSNIPLIVLIVIFALLCVAVIFVLIAHYTGVGFSFDFVEKIKSLFTRT